MIEKWNYFVYDLCEAKKKDVDEDSFHKPEIPFEGLLPTELIQKVRLPLTNINF